MINQKSCIRIKLTDTKPDIFSSKAGGLGYIPHDGNFPVDNEGNQLRLLAQIACSEIDFEPFPKSGLLQFWILDDDVYGLSNWGETETEAITQNTFRVIYYPEIDRSVTEEEIQKKFTKPAYTPKEEVDWWLPVFGEYGMSFEPAESYQQPDFEEAEELWDKYAELAEKDGTPNHQIGGYPFFTQSDPREENSKYDFLLFQLDSDYDSGADDRVMWGDAGVGNFFINSEKLKHLDFSDVLYNWDCC